MQLSKLPSHSHDWSKISIIDLCMSSENDQLFRSLAECIHIDFFFKLINNDQQGMIK